MQIALVGSGNVATRLGMALLKTTFSVNYVYSRRYASAAKLASGLRCKALRSVADIKQQSDLIIIAVKDDAISSVSNQLAGSTAVIVHTSGSIAMNVLNQHTRFGVLYPVQTLSKHRAIALRHVPFCIEASDKKTLKLITTVATAITENIHFIDSVKRQQLHLAAVMANNFSNHLFTLADSYLKKNDLTFELIEPLIMETAAKLQKNAPADLQTGPARRGDKKTIHMHLDLLKNDPQLKQLYLLFSRSIAKKYQ